MAETPSPPSRVPPEVVAYYASGVEAQRLSKDEGPLELARTRKLLERYLPPAPAVVLDVGGGTGVYALWLARKGYEVHLIDAVPWNVEEARRAFERQPERPLASVAVGDARSLDRADGRADAVLLFGLLYHLTERADRLAALREASHVLRAGGVVLAVAISRFASALDGLFRGYLDDPQFAQIVERDLADGQHRGLPDRPRYFTTAFFHRPEELQAELEEAGLVHQATLAIEGVGWLLQNLEEH